MAKPNYDRVKRQKEAMRKQKKQEKLLRKQARATEGLPGEVVEGEHRPDLDLDVVGELEEVEAPLIAMQLLRL